MIKSLSWLERFYYVSSVLLVVGAVGCVVGGGDFSSNPLNTLSLILVAAGTTGVCVLGWSLSIRSKREIARLEDAAAKANASTQQARLDIERLRVMIAWRRLGREQKQILIDSFAKLDQEDLAEVWVQFVGSDPEVCIFQEDIRETLKECGLKVNYFSGWGRAVGLKVSNCNTLIGSVICDSFTQSGISFVPIHGDIDGAPGPGTVQILVGSRPPPVEANIAY